MKFSELLWIAALVLLAALPGFSAQKQRTILFGVNYLPQVTCVEDFRPYWITDNWTENRMVTDLKIMKSIGCSGVRFHIFPSLPGIPDAAGVAPEKFLPMLDLGVKTAQELGLRVHLDIAGDVENHGEEGVKFHLNRYRGKIESYQIGNERFDLPESTENLKWLQGLLELAHSIDPKAKVTADMMVPGWVKIRDEMPELYRQLDIATAHYYPIADYRGWNSVYIADLVDYLSNPTGRKPASGIPYSVKKTFKDLSEYEAKAPFYDHDLYVGSWGCLDKEVWITEIASHGYWRWGNLTPEDKRAGDWEKVVDAVAGAKNKVTRMYHHCFRDKMSGREFGMGQSGIVYYDGSPRPVTWAFKKMAVKYSPADSPLRALDCTIARIAAADSAKTVELKVKLTNKTAKPLSGKAVLELPKGASATDGKLSFTLAPKASKTWPVKVDVGGMSWGNNHIFAKVNIPQGLVYGWGIIARPKRIVVSTEQMEPTIPVKYVDGFEEVQEFFDKYGDDCAIITGPCLGTDAEMGARLKTVIQAMRGREVQVRPSILAAEVLNRPLIVIGDPKYNLISRTAEMALPEDQRISAAKPGEGLVNVVKDPFGASTRDGRFSKQSEQLGYYFGACPAVLYIAGTDNNGTRAAAYDVIRRIWVCDKKYE